jgi:hypothetical protein
MYTTNERTNISTSSSQYWNIWKDSYHQPIKEIRCSSMAALLLTVALWFGIGIVPAIAADIEPNDTCPAAQDLGAVSLPFNSTGAIATTTDMDFYKVTAEPNSLIQIDLARQTAGFEPIIRVYSSACQFLREASFNFIDGAQLRLTVPSDGIFVVEAGSSPDFLTGERTTGNYQLTLTKIPVIGSISGQVVDATNNLPLPSALVELLKCDTTDFCFSVASITTNSTGSFQFERNFLNEPFLIGNYLVRAQATEYQPGSSKLIAVAENQDLDLNNLVLVPFPIRFSEIRPCGDLPPEGGTCRFSARINNRSLSSLDGRVWNIIDSFGIGSFIDLTRFQVGSKAITIAPLQSTVVRFSFQVPNTVKDGVNVCATTFVGQGNQPFFNTIGKIEPLFCLRKGFTGGGFSILSANESKVAFKHKQQGILKGNSSSDTSKTTK